ncbi:MAG: hypothetical protein AAB919_02785 [Patescibacteria group bacterium]
MGIESAASVDLKPLVKILRVLFEFTPQIKTATVCEARFEVPLIRGQVNSAWLRELEPARDRMVLLVCLHPNVTVSLCLQLGPPGALARSVSELRVAMATIFKRFPPESVETKESTLLKTRLQKRAKFVSNLFARVPDATLEDRILLAAHGLFKTALKKRANRTLSVNTIVDTIKAADPAQSPTREALNAAIATLSGQGYVKLAKPVSNGTCSALLPLEAGQQRAAELLSKKPH